MVVTLVRITRHRRFTANHTWYVDWGRKQLFVKASPAPAEAQQECAGHSRLRDYYPVPRLRGTRRIGRWTILVYDRWPNLGSGRGLLLDEIVSADLDGELDLLDVCLDTVFSRYQRVIDHTLRRTTVAGTVTKLYGDRAAPGGRLDAYYRPNVPWLTDGNGWSLRPSELATTRLVVNGREYALDFGELMVWLRCSFAQHVPVWAALTQGDPTDINIGWSPEGGPVWFDYDTGGYNALAGEFACFLLYQRLHGAWLVPRYNSAAFRDHPATFSPAALATPNMHAQHGPGRLIIDYEHAPSPARRHVLRRYLNELVHPIAAELGIDEVIAWLRPYLVMRVLGVYHLGELTPSDTALCLALLAEVLDPATGPPGFFGLASSPISTGPVSTSANR
jgi:hypothetical protein